jgi:prepilin-type N-terminal cleavage/methylation domain-containing protein
MKRNKAFTLIELMIVISVISLLATVVMYSTSEAKLKADDAHMKVESNSVATAYSYIKMIMEGKHLIP